MKRHLPTALFLLAVPMFIYSVQRIFLNTPIESKMGTVQ